MATTKEDMLKKIKSTPVVTRSIKQQVEGTAPATQQSRELDAIQQRTEASLVKPKPIVTEDIRQAVEGTRQPTTATAPTATVSKYEEMLAKLKDPTPTAEELEAERKRERRKAIFAAIGDGVSSLANLYFTTKGAPNSYNATDNMTAAQRERYEKLLDDRKKDQEMYFNQYLRLSQLGDNANWRKQQAEYQRQRDQLADKRYAEQQKQRAAQILADAERWQKEFDYRKENDDKDRKAKADAQKQQNTQFWATHNRLKEAADNKAAAQDAKNRHGFPDGAGGTYSIHKDIIANQKGVIYEAILQDLAESEEYGITAPYQKRDAVGNEVPMTDAQLLQYIKMNGYKSPRAVEIMERLQYEDPNKIQSGSSKPQPKKGRGVASWAKKDENNSNKIEF